MKRATSLGEVAGGLRLCSIGGLLDDDRKRTVVLLLRLDVRPGVVVDRDVQPWAANVRQDHPALVTHPKQLRPLLADHVGRPRADPPAGRASAPEASARACVGSVVISASAAEDEE